MPAHIPSLSQSKKLRLAVVIPVFNEEQCIAKVIGTWSYVLAAEVGSLEFSMLVVDDGSTDSTATILGDLAKQIPEVTVIRQPNQGHGAAILRGYREALVLGADWIFQVDSDDQFIPSDFSKLWQKKASAQFLLGYRKNRADPWLRRLTSLSLRLAIRTAFGHCCRDPNCPFRLMHHTPLRRMLYQLPSDAFAPNLCLAILGKRLLGGLSELSVTHRMRQSGATSLNGFRLIRAGLLCLRDLIRLRLQLKRAETQ